MSHMRALCLREISLLNLSKACVCYRAELMHFETFMRGVTLLYNIQYICICNPSHVTILFDSLHLPANRFLYSLCILYNVSAQNTHWCVCIRFEHHTAQTIDAFVSTGHSTWSLGGHEKHCISKTCLNFDNGNNDTILMKHWFVSYALAKVNLWCC